MTEQSFKQKHQPTKASLILLDSLIHKTIDQYDTLEEAYHMNRYDWMSKTKCYLPASYSAYRAKVTRMTRKKSTGVRANRSAKNVVNFYRELQS